MISTLVFWFIALLTAGSAVLVVTAKNILHAGFALCLTFLGVAGLYVFLHADFVAAVQLIVYVGGILVLIMFAIMFSSNVVEDTAEGGRSKLAMLTGATGAFAIFAAIVLLIKKFSIVPSGVTTFHETAGPLQIANQHAADAYVATVSVSAGQTGIGHLLMGPYLLPFEFASILLLAALIGAVVIVRKELN
jgi:NADH:ubiquinone oxidoreductase subunit 6 (subunit J)